MSLVAPGRPADSGALARTFIAREPIVDRNRAITGYHLRFSQPGAETPAPGHDTARLIVDALSQSGSPPSWTITWRS
ncbi:MAG: hypothetical protein R2712_09405 [Vicinamibacterales bacterium]